MLLRVYAVRLRSLTENITYCCFKVTGFLMWLVFHITFCYMNKTKMFSQRQQYAMLKAVYEIHTVVLEREFN